MPLAETDAEGRITRSYIWSSHGLLAHIDAVAGVADPGSIRYYHADEQGSTLALTDGNGTVTDQFAYTPYGGVTRTGTTQTPFQWLGGIAVQNEGNGLYYMLNRYYSAAMKKLFFVDPYGLCADSFNWKTSLSGAAQMFGGGIEATAGYTFGAITSPTVAGGIAGAIVGTHGLDNVQAGFRQMVTGQPVDTMTSLSIQSFGVNRNTANMANAGLSIAFTAGAGYLNASAQSVNTVNLVASDIGGNPITGYTTHGLNQAISRNGGQGVSPSAILDAVRNPAQVVQQTANQTIKFVGDDATVVLNQQGKVVTTWGIPRGTQ